MVLSRGSEITKTTQILRYLLSFDDNGKMNRTKLIKLLWAADRYHVRHYGRLVSEGNYVAMRFGPVASLALDVAQVKNDFAFDNTMATAAKIADDHLSETDKEALQWAWDTFGKKDAFDMANNISHRYPEWSQYEDFFISSGGRGRKEIDPERFFDNPQNDGFFVQDASQLAAAHERYIDNNKIYTILGL